MTHENNLVESALVHYSDLVYKIALTQMRNPHDAEDVFQDVFLQLLKSKRHFESQEHLKAWIIKVTINRCKKLFNKHRSTVSLHESMPSEDEQDDFVLETVMTLPRKYRIVIHLFYYEQMSVKEIASALKTKEGTVKSQLFRGRELLRESIEKEEQHEYR